MPAGVSTISEGRTAPSWRNQAWRRDMVTSGIGIWLVVAVFSDGWAHVNVPELESFFTPWHLALYSGFLVMSAWIAHLAWRARRPGTPFRDALPWGYRGAAAGAVVFGCGAVADLIWHEVFGVEVAVDALVSPPHLVLGAGGLLILSAPMRAHGVLSPLAAGGRYDAPVLLSLVLSTALVGFFLLYTSPFTRPAAVETFVPTPEGTPGHEAAELPVIAGLAGYLVSTMVIVMPVLLMLRGSGRLPRYGVTLLVGTLAGLSVVVVDLPRTALAGAVGATLGALAVDAVLIRLQRQGHDLRRHAPAVLAGLAVAVWSGQLGGLAVADGIGWPVPLWSGVVVLTGFTAGILGLLASPRP